MEPKETEYAIEPRWISSLSPARRRLSSTHSAPDQGTFTLASRGSRTVTPLLDPALRLRRCSYIVRSPTEGLHERMRQASTGRIAVERPERLGG